MKGSMVAAVFMHLSHEKRWSADVLLTAAFFMGLLLLPLFTSLDSLGDRQPLDRRKGRAGSHVAQSLSPAVHRAVDRAGGVSRRVGRRPVSRGPRCRLPGRRRDVARERRGSRGVRRRVSAEDEEM